MPQVISTWLQHRMRGWRARPFLGLLLVPILFPGCLSSPAAETADYRDCLSCHQGVEKISPDHDFACASCHLLPEDRTEALADHSKIVRNPSDPAHVSLFCGTCHRKEVGRVNLSLHATMAGVINQTRYLWGAQPSSTPAVYGLSGSLKPLPEPDPLVYPDEPPKLVDDFLRRRCLRCHLNGTGSTGEGLYRASGCAACHMVYDDDGLYKGGDRALDPSKKGYPSFHRLTRVVPNRQCLHCHNGNRVGADYEGMFQRDFNSMFQVGGWEPSPAVYGIGSHRLSKDTHAEKGLLCIDCHTGREIMGDGRSYSFQMEVPKRTCSECHGNLKDPGPARSAEGVQAVSGGYSFFSKSGKMHPLPLFSNASAAHRAEHERVRCSACHAQWSFQDYGLSVIREDVIEGRKWYRLTKQGDPDLERVLSETVERGGRHYPASRDRLTGEAKPGIWSSGWRYRRWEEMPLGVDREGKFSILRPLYQYLISYEDKLGGRPLDNAAPERGDKKGKGWAFMPYVPHTTAPAGRGCESCHLDRVAAGLGTDEDPTPDTALTKPAPPAVSGMRLLTPREQEKLLHPSKRWQKERFKSLSPPPATPSRSP